MHTHKNETKKKKKKKQASGQNSGNQKVKAIFQVL